MPKVQQAAFQELLAREDALSAAAMAHALQTSILSGLKCPQQVQQPRRTAALSRAPCPLPARRGSLQIRASGIEIPEVKPLEPEINDAVNSIRFLSIDGVNAANSGHPGLPMG